MAGDVAWTPEQRTALELAARRRSVLAAASAGTGKTQVLTHAVVRQILFGDPPCDITDLLVVTFTRVAAGGMRSRIAEHLSGLSQARPELRRRVERQVILLDRAEVDTLHAFCASMLREDHRLLGLDPAFEVLSDGARKRLRAESVLRTFEDAYADPGPFRGAFRDFVEAYGADLSDENLFELVLRLDEFLASLTDYRDWLSRARQATDGCGDGVPPGEPQLLHLMDRELEGFEHRLGRLAGYIAANPEAGFYRDYIEQCVEHVRAVRRRLSAEPERPGAAVLELHLPHRRPPPRKAAPAALVHLHAVAAEHGELRRAVGRFQKTYGGLERVRMSADAVAAAPHVRVLLELVERFGDVYRRRKAERNAVDYADIERLSLRLLCGSDSPADPAGLVPTAAAQRRRRRFQYVLVDEYQDINPVQDAVLRLISRDSTNLFLVGDVKQSIYAFRQADPERFLMRHRESVAALDADEADPRMRRVALRASFRSRPAVLEAINALMARIMTRGSAEIDYADAGPLVRDPEHPYREPAEGLPPARTPAVEVWVIDKDGADRHAAEPESDDEADARLEHREAAFVAATIRRMVVGREFSVLDEAAGGRLHRPVRYRDIVVLLRAASGKRAEHYAAALRDLGVPVQSVSDADEPSVERRDVINLLRVLDNPRDEPALVGLLRSPLLGLSDVELAEVRRHDRTGGFFDALERFAANAGRPAIPTPTTAPPDTEARPAAEAPRRRLRRVDPDQQVLFETSDRPTPAAPPAPSSTADKCAAALKTIDDWRTELRRFGAAAALSRVYRETGYPTYVRGLADGGRRRDELRAMLDVVADFERERDDDARPADRLAEAGRVEIEQRSAAAALPEGRDAVRILTVHAAKGLEFPVVFLPELGKPFNTQDLARPFLWGRRHGLGAAAVNLDDWTRRPTAAHRVIAAEHLDRIRAEEIRILYTALTRARECLVLTAAGRADAVSALGRLDRGGPLPDDVLRSARCAADWLIAAAAGGGPGMPTVRILRADQPIDAGPESPREVPPAERGATAPVSGVGAAEADRTGPEPTEPPDLPEPIESLVRRLEWTWPVGGLAGVAAHRSVTELRQAAAPQPDSADDAAPVRPRFVQAGPQPPAANEIGTAVHAVLEHVDFTGPADEPALRALIERLIAQGRIAPALGAAIPVPAIAQFLSGPTGLFLRGHAAAVRREVPVTFAVPAGELDPKLSEPDGRETVLVRGVIDALVDCGGGFRLIDYKTDAVDAGGLAAKVDEYRRQLELYRRAVEAIWGKPVTRATLCFLSAGRDVDLWNDDGVVGAPR